MAITEFAPEEVSEMSVETLLDSLSLGVMRDNIIHQIHGSIDSQQNFLSIVIEKFNDIIQNVDDSEIARELNQEIALFCQKLINEIVQEYGLMFDNYYDGSMECVEMLSVLYNFFVLKRKECVTNFLITYIQENRQYLMDSIESISDEKSNTMDITTISNKKKNIQKDNVWVLSNISSIINFINAVNVDFSELLSLINDGDYYISKLVDYVDEGRIGGDITAKYVGELTSDYSSSDSTEIRNSVRLAFMV